jgi:hypothetical protein
LDQEIKPIRIGGILTAVEPMQGGCPGAGVDLPGHTEQLG